MLVKWNGLGLLGLTGEGGKPVVLKPGLNSNMSEADWAILGAHPIVKQYVSEGKLEVLEASKKKKADAPAASPVEVLCAMSVSEAKKAISETIDVPLLKAWRKAESRTEVTKAIRAQIKELEKPPVYRG